MGMDTSGFHEYPVDDDAERVSKRVGKKITDVEDRFKQNTVCKDCK